MNEKHCFELRAPFKWVLYVVSSLSIFAACPSSAATTAPPPAPPANAPSSAPLYAPGVDALARAATMSAAAQAQAAIAARCKRLIAANTPRAQMPAECAPFLPPLSVSIAPAFVYAPVLLGTTRVPPAVAPAPAPSSGLPTDPAALKKFCDTLLARGNPYSQLPAECKRIVPDPANATSPSAPSASTGNTPMCPDPTVVTHVRMVPCPGPVSPAPLAPPAPSASPSAQRTTPPAPVAATPATPAPAPAPTPAPVAVAPAPVTAPPSPPPSAPPPPPPPPPPPAPTAMAAITRAPASQIPSGGGSAGVSPLSLPPPRAPSAAPAAPTAAQALPQPDTNDFEPGEVIVFAPFATSASGALEVIANAGGTVVGQDNLAALEGLLLRVRANDGDAPRLAQILRAQLPQAAVDLHGRLFLFPLSGSSGPGGAPRHYARAMLNFPATPPAPRREVRVGIIDSGVERVGALRNGVASERSFLPNEQSPADSIHGTAVAALIAGQDDARGFSGAAPGAKLFVARAMSTLPDGRSYTNAVSVLQALNWLVSERVPVVNMSLGGKGDATLALGIAQAIRKGATIVAAAGNGGANATASFPAALPDVVAVTAVDVETKLYKDANRGDYVMVSAPGVDVWAPQREGGGSYVSGTSFATAWVSGALAFAAAQSAEPSQAASSNAASARLSDALCKSSKDLGRSGRDAEFGCGLLQVSTLLNAVQNNK